MSVTALTASQPLNRRSPQRSKRPIRLSSPCGWPSRPAWASASISAIVSNPPDSAGDRLFVVSAIRSGSR